MSTVALTIIRFPALLNGRVNETESADIIAPGKSTIGLANVFRLTNEIHKKAMVIGLINIAEGSKPGTIKDKRALPQKF